MNTVSIIDTQFGRIRIEETHGSVSRVSFLSSQRRVSQKATLMAKKVKRAIAQEDNLLMTIPLQIQGTHFQQKVWNYLRTIPVGTVKSYRQVAEAIGHPTAVRAVASACARNTIALLVPCHRVIRSDGTLGGYRWGITRKKSILQREQEAMSRES